jgi:RHS repeat-associated protein
MRTRAGLDDATNDWTTLPTPTGPDAEKYRSSYTYDANGNIRTADRWDQAGAPYDALAYGYKEATGAKLLRNRLYQVDDLADPTNALVNAGPGEQAVDLTHTGPSGFDPQDQNIETAYNYRYDELGNLTHDAAAHIDAIAWTVAGKVRAVDHAAGQGPDLAFGYGAGGQRISKQVGGTVGDPGTYREHYIRDAQGNIMATYRLHPNGAFRVQERPIYGSSRVGLYAGKVDLYPATQLVPMPQVIPVFDALLRYELTDHLGNVGTVVTGRLLVGDGAPHEAQVLSAQGYEPFGSLLPGRHYSSDSYRFGFNGKENDNEVHNATGTFQDYGMRAYDTRVGRFFSVDPIANEYPELTPYQFASLKPIWLVDIDGLEGGIAKRRPKPLLSHRFSGKGLIPWLGGSRGKYFRRSVLDLPPLFSKRKGEKRSSGSSGVSVSTP